MLWVGGGILVHGTHELGFAWPDETLHHASVAVSSAVPFGGAVLGWLVTAIGSAIVGLLVGGVIAFVVHQFKHRGHGSKPPADGH